MQGHHSAVGSSAGIIDFEHGTASSNAAMNGEMFWNDQPMSVSQVLVTSGNTRLPHYGAGGQNLSLWSQGEASSSSMPNAAGCSEQKLENGWPSGTLNSETVTGFDDWYNNTSQDNIPNFGPLSLRGSSGETSLQNQLASSADASAQNLNLNVRISGQSDDHIQFIESHNSYRSGFSGSGQRPVNGNATTTHSFITPDNGTGNGSHSIGDNGRRFDGSQDASRLSCKRKFIDEDIGQSSASGSARSNQHVEGSSWHPIPVDDCDSSLNMFGSHRYSHPVHGFSSRNIVSESLPDVSQVDHGRNNTRNRRLRLSSSVQPPVPVNIGSAGSAFTPANDSGLQQPDANASLPPLLSFLATPEISNQQIHPAPAHMSLPRNGHSFRRSRGSRSASSSGVVFGERGSTSDAQQAEATLRMSRQLLERHMHTHQLLSVSRSRNLPASRGSSNSNTAAIIPPDPALVAIPALNSEPNASGNGNTPAGRTWGPGHNFPSGQRIAEIVRRSVAAGGGSGHASSRHNQTLPMQGASSSRQPSSGIYNQGSQLAHRRLALLMQRRGHGLPGIPYSLQSLGAAGDDRSRLLSEIWSALDSMRRGEPLRPEDMVILDQAGLFGIAAELHDRHRDMRLDVDNMSYEELLALEERIGNVNTGLTEEAVMKCLKQRKFFAPATVEEETEPCCICQEEYNEGENLGILDCGHNFHTDCVKQWLMVKNLCPVCKTTGLASK